MLEIGIGIKFEKEPNLRHKYEEGYGSVGREFDENELFCLRAMIKYRTISKTLIQLKFKRKFVSRNYFLSHPLHMELY